MKRLLLAPVGHGKSWLATTLEALHRICYDKNIRILLVSKKFERAHEDVQMIRREVETMPGCGRATRSSSPGSSGATKRSPSGAR